MAGRNVPEAVRQCFSEIFGRQALDAFQQPAQEARALRDQGRIEQALVSYEHALKAQPYNWFLADEVARFLMTVLKDFEAALQMTVHALSLNPSYSANLWCNLGDCRKALKMPEVKECFRQALEIDPENARARFGLGLVAVAERDYATALREFADALRHDKNNDYRERILNEQKDVLGLLNQRWERERRNLANRVNRVIEIDTK
jgi:tetratricopeptide (TPR) repeat protein